MERIVVNAKITISIVDSPRIPDITDYADFILRDLVDGPIIEVIRIGDVQKEDV